MQPQFVNAVKATCGQGSVCSVAGFRRTSSIMFRPRSVYHTINRNKTRFAYPEGMKAYEDDYSETPEYPPLAPELRNQTSTQKLLIQKQKDFEATIRNARTVDEKLMQWNVPRKYGWYSYDLQEQVFAYDSLPYYQFVTRTHFMPRGELPERYSQPDIADKVKSLSESLKQPLEDVLRLELREIRRKIDEKDELSQTDYMLAQAHNIAYQVNRVLTAFLSQSAPHLKDCEVDYKPKLEAFWRCGGLEPTLQEQRRQKNKANFIEKKLKLKSPIVEKDPVQRNFQYQGSSILQIRCKDPISNFVESDSPLCKVSEQIPERMRYSRTNYGIKPQLRLATILPGHWAGNDYRSSLLSIHPQHYLYLPNKQNKFWEGGRYSALDSQAALTSFSRMLAQAYFYGFDQFTDLDYPFSTQSISTDGESWAFYSYQLNTIGLGEYQYKSNKLQNLCWRTENMKILDDTGNLNMQVLENLIKFYLNPPTPIKSPKGGNITPYISERLFDVKDDYQRALVNRNLREMYCHKHTRQGGTHKYPEIYDWERIYKIYFNARPQEPRRRHFELPKIYPEARPYDEPYRLRDPWSMPKALFRYKRILREEKEQKELEAAKIVEKRKYIKEKNVRDDDEL